ncbi:hypothetical protein DPMN_175394 [Dreissena polymorpha]|uniref:Uncharacterized protein n=1 Tax=Dreissena polymorpha TaxID=45954 RepID=A0A9D4E6H6_DREPO|nr:hypothetical protein DPMN_175394 [Dreissena polymorpha]
MKRLNTSPRNTGATKTEGKCDAGACVPAGEAVKTGGGYTEDHLLSSPPGPSEAEMVNKRR